MAVALEWSTILDLTLIRRLILRSGNETGSRMSEPLVIGTGGCVDLAPRSPDLRLKSAG